MNHTATYSPEDNKLRIYPGDRLDDELGEEYAEFKKAGYRWAAKQECFVCPRWTPKAEDWALRLAGEIEDEDYSPLERSADRAERFGCYRDKRRTEAHDHADTFEAGPSAFGHQNQQRAERQAARLDKQRVKAVSQWSKAEYWQRRTAGVISHALYKARPEVRRGRIKKLEADQRKHLKVIELLSKCRENWQKVAGCDDPEKALKWAIALAGNASGWQEFAHPETGRKATLYSLLQPYEGIDDRPITGHEAAALYLSLPDVNEPGSSWSRWTAHYELRMSYENAMLANEGGQAGEVEMEPGGWIFPDKRQGRRLRYTEGNGDWYQIVKVNRSPVTKRVTSVVVSARSDNNYDNDGKPFGEDNPRPVAEQRIDVTRLGKDSYRAPTDQEREVFKQQQAERKAKAKASKPKSVKLLNPTDEDAERLQGILNDKARKKYDKAHPEGSYQAGKFEPAEVCRMTQAKYSARSRGDYSTAETRTFHNFGGIIARKSSNMWSQHGQEYDAALGPAVCKLRTADSGGYAAYTPQRIVILTDKPQKPLPLDWDNLGCEKPQNSEALSEVTA
ncbi:DUF3560 domain-containing protein [Gimesia fumaroli]|uniref:DUF3560 domain-containing protein n=1 Tax=Gimesia fumaroli TaxID=2527976 RepID=A0A518I902_9PLAN|nr:DUF3560 domain-containing protein [Gimesia fumaroli]QDV49593.1 hypothetical protein Enr17x_16130 [Gimesia fumaroli]